jgi:hypothetical protein
MWDIPGASDHNKQTAPDKCGDAIEVPLAVP